MTIVNRISVHARISVQGEIPPDREGYGHG